MEAPNITLCRVTVNKKNNPLAKGEFTVNFRLVDAPLGTKSPAEGTAKNYIVVIDR